MSQAKTIEPRDFTQAVADIKLAILQTRARAAQNVNVDNVDAVKDEDIDRKP